MARLRWGILGTSNFARNKMIPALQRCEHAEVSAIASRTPAKAEAVAAQFGISKTYGTYEALIADKEIDVVYNPLPNHLHVPWSIRALEAGKHVLCEKPLALSAAEAQQLVEVSISNRHRQLKIMEAFMYRMHPQWLHARQILRDGGIGDLRTIHSLFSYFNADAGNIRNHPEFGGGGLMDIGCYNVSLSRFLFDSEPHRVLGIVDYDPQFKTDRLASGILDFGQGTATFTCSTQLVLYQRVNVLGTTGRIEIEIPFNAPPDKPCRLWHQRGNELEEVLFDPCNQYTIQADLFSLSVLNDTPVPTPLTDAVKNMKVLEAVLESGKRSEWVSVQ
jgi:predicted dehydrogenase